MDKLAKVLGERIRTQRKIRHMSQDVLALACSIDRSYMGRIERGEQEWPSVAAAQPPGVRLVVASADLSKR
jgi:transcriptional regulator with XRE-family HTH domain